MSSQQSLSRTISNSSVATSKKGGSSGLSRRLSTKKILSKLKRDRSSRKIGDSAQSSSQSQLRNSVEFLSGLESTARDSTEIADSPLKAADKSSEDAIQVNKENDKKEVTKEEEQKTPEVSKTEFSKEKEPSRKPEVTAVAMDPEDSKDAVVPVPEPENVANSKLAAPEIPPPVTPSAVPNQIYASTQDNEEDPNSLLANGSSSAHNQDNLDADEATMLLPKPATAPSTPPSERQSSIFSYNCWNIWLLVALFVFCVLAAGLRVLMVKTQLLYSDIANLYPKSIQLNEVNDEGINVSMDAVLAFEEVALHGWAKWYVNLIKKSVQDVEIAGINRAEVSIGLINYNDGLPSSNYESFPVIDFQLEDPINISLQSFTPINITNQQINILENGTIKLLNNLLEAYKISSYNLNNLELNMDVKLEGCVLKHDSFSKNFSTSLSKKLFIDTSDLNVISSFANSNSTFLDNDFVSIYLNNFLLTGKSLPSYHLLGLSDLTIKVNDNVLNGSVNVGDVSFNFKIPDCNGNLTRLSSFEISQFDLIGGKKTKNIKSQLKIPVIKANLLEICHENVSPLNHMTSLLLKEYDPSDKIVTFLDGASSNNVHWVNEIVNTLEIPIDLNLLKYGIDSSNFDKSNIFHDYLIDTDLHKLQVYLPKQVSKYDISPLITESEIDFKLELPKFVDFINSNLLFNVDKFDGHIDISHYRNDQISDIAEIDFLVDQEMNLKFDYSERNIAKVFMRLLNDQIKITNGNEIGRILRESILPINYNSEVELLKFNIKPTIDFNLNGFPLINGGDNFVFRDIPLSMDYYFNTSFLIPDNKSDSKGPSLIDELISSLLIEIVDVVYIASTEDSLTLITNFKVFTPGFLYEDFTKQLSLTTDTISNNLVDFLFGYEDTKFGHAILKEFDFNSSEIYSNVSMLISLDPKSFIGYNDGVELKIRQLLSEFISNEFPRIDVFGYNQSFPSSQQISNILDELHVSFKLPEFNCPVKANDLQPIANDNFLIKDIWKFLDGKNHQLGQSSSNSFILSVTMHILSSEIELEVYNPIINSYVDILILSGKAIYHEDEEEIELAHVQKNILLRIPPGVSKTPRLAITYETTGKAGEILRRALNGKLEIETRANFNGTIGDYTVELNYSGDGTFAQIRF